LVKVNIFKDKGLNLQAGPPRIKLYRVPPVLGCYSGIGLATAVFLAKVYAPHEKYGEERTTGGSKERRPSDLKSNVLTTTPLRP